VKEAGDRKAGGASTRRTARPVSPPRRAQTRVRSSRAAIDPVRRVGRAKVPVLRRAHSRKCGPRARCGSWLHNRAKRERTVRACWTLPWNAGLSIAWDFFGQAAAHGVPGSVSRQQCFRSGTRRIFRRGRVGAPLVPPSSSLSATAINQSVT